MAEGKKLWLELGLDLTDFEAAFASADKTAKEKQKALSGALDKVSKSFEIQINKAKLAGDNERALALDTERLAAKVELLKRAEEGLSRARDAAIKGGNAKEIAAAEAEYTKAVIRRQKMELAYKNQQNKSGANGIVEAMKSLAANSKYGGVFNAVTERAGTLQKTAASLGLTLSGPVAGGFAAVAAGAIAYKKAMDMAQESALKAAQDGKEVYRIMSLTGMKQSEAEQFGDAFAIAGESPETAIQAMLRLNKSLLDTSDAGKKLKDTLKVYGVELYDSTGKIKSYKDQLLALSQAYKAARDANYGQEFASEIFGGRAASIIPVLEKWERVYELAGNANSTGLMDAKTQNETLEILKQLEAVRRHSDSRFGDALAKAEKEHLEGMVELEKEINDNVKTSRDSYLEFGKAVGATLKVYREVYGWVKKARIEAEKTAIAVATPIIRNILDRDALEKEAEAEAQAVKEAGGLENYIKNKEAEEANKAATEATEEEAERARKAKEIAERKRLQEQEEANKKQLAENEKLEKERQAKEKQAIQARVDAENKIRSILQTGYQNRLQQIETEKQAWIKAGADEVAATEAAERQKAEVRKSEAEKALTSQKKLWRAYLRMGDSAEFQEYALRQQMRSMGISKKDYESMTASGLAGFTDAMANFRNNTWLSQLNGSVGDVVGRAAAKPSANVNVSITMDNIVVESMGTIERLANKVADAIQPSIDKALGGTQYGY